MASTPSVPKPDAADKTKSSLSISEAYHKANVLYQKVKESTLSSNSTEYNDLVKDAIRAIVQVEKMTRTLALFSDNEELRDISSVNLKYLLCDFITGDLFMSLQEQKIREGCIKESLAHLKKFLEKCKELKLMSESDIAMYKREGKPGSITTARAEKIERHKNMRRMKGELQELLKIEKLMAEKNGVVEDDDLEEDDVQRRKHLLMIKLAISEGLDHLRFGNDELKMLEFMRSRKGSASQERAPPKKPSNGKSSILHINSAEEFLRANGITRKKDITQGMKQLNMAPASHARKIATPYEGKANARTEVLNTMYVPRNMPTMDMDTFLELERKAGNLPMQMPPPKKQDLDEPESEDSHSDNDNDEAHNARQKKRRDWDNWKDDNEKGAGNRLSNPRGRNFI